MKGVDFIQTNLINLDKIIRPAVNTRNESKRQTSIIIEKSFVPEKQSNLP